MYLFCKDFIPVCVYFANFGIAVLIVLFYKLTECIVFS